MTRDEAIAFFNDVNECTYGDCEPVEMAIKALEQKPYEKFKSAKDHIYKLASDYKCWDNRLTQDEALELCHILEKQEPILDKIRAEIEELDEYYDNDYFSGNKDAMYKCNEVLQIIDKYRESEV